MPNKDDRHDKANSTVLQKAKSFKDDIKSKIIRRTPSVPRNGHKSPRVSKKSLQRGNSFSEKKDKTVSRETDVEKLKIVSKEVDKSLSYLQDVLDKNILQLLAGSVTIVLETIMELCQLIGNYTANQDSTLLASQYGQVNQSLAALIKWSDNVVLQEPPKVDSEPGIQAIKRLEQAVQKLLSLSMEKIEKKPSSEPESKKTCSPNTLPLPDPQDKRSSLPDIPLTPREKKILAETTFFNNEDDVDASKPPPKPPLPSSFELEKKLRHTFTDDVFSGSSTDSPPPLPVKQRQSSTTSVYDNAMTLTTPRLSTGSHGDLISGDSTPVNQSSPPCRLQIQGAGGPETPGSLSPASPGGSVSSIEELPGAQTGHYEGIGLTNSLTASYQAYNTARMSHYDNMQTQTIKHFTQQMKELTCSMESDSPLSLTLYSKPPPLPSKKHGGMGAADNSQLSPGYLRESRRDRSVVPSQYDNVLAQIRNDPLNVPMKLNLESTGIRTSHSALAFSSSSSANFRATTQSTQMVSKSMYVSMECEGHVRQQQQQQHQQQQQQHQISSCSATHQQHHHHHMATSISSNAILSSSDTPPPLPEKKGKIDQYLAVTFGQYTGPSLVDISRHSVTYYQSQYFEHQMELFNPLYPRSTTLSRMSDVSSRSSDVFSVTSASSEDSSGIISGNSAAHTPALPAKQGSTSGGGVVSGGNGSSSSSGMSELGSLDEPPPQPDIVRCSTTPDKDAELNLLDSVDVSDYLLFKKSNSGTTELRGGTLDALVVHAAAATGRNHFMYQEAFLTTYRTFLAPSQLLAKLLHRYRRFSRVGDTRRKKLSRNAFSLLIRVVDELCMDVGEGVLQLLLELVLELVQDGELMLARILRKKGLEKIDTHKQHMQNIQHITLLSSYQLSSKQYKLTDFKSEQIAEQMTLLDAMLFLKIEIPEVLLWAREQNEEQSPNLTEFTEHFNKMSYWCRTQVLQQEEARDRERVLIKFIKIMKHLRRLNNFNSYLALLSALDSAPVRRLEWQKQNLEVLKEFCQLIDSSSSFRAYRQALAETEPPCIPYIGLILQDLTFVHIGNPDFLPDHKDFINFSKRWQQFHILDNMRRFKKCNYQFKKNQKVITFFNNFDDCLSEESLWQISENIKPRVTKKKPNPT